MKKDFVLLQLSFALMMLGAGLAAGQGTAMGPAQGPQVLAYPTKTVRIVTAGAGGGVDLLARLVAQGLGASWGQSVVVENRGGSVANPAGVVAQAPPDGHTLLFYSGGFWIAPLIQKTPYDPLKDFVPVTLAASAPNLLVVHPSLPAKSVMELIALAKARPGQLNFATSGIGGTNHLAAELFKAMAGVDIVGVNYKSATEALNRMISGDVQLMFPGAGGASSFIKSGRVRALAITSLQRSMLFPDLPTVADSGLPGYQSDTPYGIWAPAKTPAALASRLNKDIVAFLNKPEVNAKFLAAGLEVVGSSPEQLTAIMKSEMVRFDKIIRDAGLREQR